MRNHTGILLAIASLAVVACNNTGSTTAPETTKAPETTHPQATTPTTTAAPTAAPSGSAAERREMRHHGWGPAGMFFAAADDLQLKPEQKTAIEKAEQDLKPDPAMQSDWKSFHDTLVSGVKAGKIDTAKLDPIYGSMEKNAQAQADKQADALNTLHKTLDATQRKQVVDSIRAKHADMEKRMAEHKAEKDKEKDADRAKQKVERMTKELDLDAGQQKQVETILTKNAPAMDHDAMIAEWKKKHDALLDAFASDTFDAKKLDLGSGPMKKMKDHMQQRVKTLSDIVGVLKPEQREKLATQMEKTPGRGMRPGMMPGMGMGPMGPGGHDEGMMHGPMMMMPFDDAPMMPGGAGPMPGGAMPHGAMPPAGGPAPHAP